MTNIDASANNPSHEERWDANHTVSSEAMGHYTASKSEFAKNYMNNLSATHPERHGGLRTLADVHNDLDAGHKMMASNWGGRSISERTSRTGRGAGASIFHPLNSFQAQGQHEKAMQLGYAANSHTYMNRQANASRP
jgi:hypothetical protein